MLTGAKLERRTRERSKQAMLKIAGQRAKDRHEVEAAARRAAVAKEFAAQNRNTASSRTGLPARAEHRRRENRGLNSSHTADAKGARPSSSTRRVSRSGAGATGISKEKAAGSTRLEQGTAARPAPLSERHRNTTSSRTGLPARAEHRRRENRGLNSSHTADAKGARPSSSTRRVSRSGAGATGIRKEKAAGSTRLEQGTAARPAPLSERQRQHHETLVFMDRKRRLSAREKRQEEEGMHREAEQLQLALKASIAVLQREAEQQQLALKELVPRWLVRSRSRRSLHPPSSGKADIAEGGGRPGGGVPGGKHGSHRAKAPSTARGSEIPPARRTAEVAYDEKRWGWEPGNEEAEAAEEEKSGEQGDGSGGGCGGGGGGASVQKKSSLEDNLISILASLKRSARTVFAMLELCARQSEVIDEPKAVHPTNRLQPTEEKEAPSSPPQDAKVEETRRWRGTCSSRMALSSSVPAVLEQRDFVQAVSLRPPAAQPCPPTALSVGLLSSVGPATRGSGSTSAKREVSFASRESHQVNPSDPPQDAKVEETRRWRDTCSSRMALSSSVPAVLEQREPVQAVSLRPPAAQPCPPTALSVGLLSSAGPATRGSGSTSAKREGLAASREGPHNHCQNTGVSGETASQHSKWDVTQFDWGLRDGKPQGSGDGAVRPNLATYGHSRFSLHEPESDDRSFSLETPDLEEAKDSSDLPVTRPAEEGKDALNPWPDTIRVYMNALIGRDLS